MNTKKDFKTQLVEDLIPAVKRMKEKEEEHLRMLRSHETMFPNRQLSSYIRNSEHFLAHFEQRLREYTEYAEKLESELS